MVMRAFAFAAVVSLAAGSAAFAADRSIRDALPHSPAASCCVEVILLPPLETSIASDSRALHDVNQMAPVTEVKIGLDGADWSCRRPDGSQRCVSNLLMPHY